MPDTSEAKKSEMSEFEVKKILLQGHARGMGDSCPSKCLTPQRVSMKHFFFLNLFRAAHMACGNSQARGQIRAMAAGLCHSYNNASSELHL